MLKKLERMLPHAAILICNMYIVFFLIDRVNQAMNFIDNGLTKGLLLILCAIAFYNARCLLKPAPVRRSVPARGSGYGDGAAIRRRAGEYPARTRDYRAGSYREDDYRDRNYRSNDYRSRDHRD
ncbi:MAG: hypothetical protein IJ649_05495, partial [Oscillospiraceae bacterium]|nr:hypothetical protein [Oscillospiraceae bacterium]